MRSLSPGELDVELARFHQLHGGHPYEGLGDGVEEKARLRGDWYRVLHIGHAIVWT